MHLSLLAMHLLLLAMGHVFSDIFWESFSLFLNPNNDGLQPIEGKEVT